MDGGGQRGEAYGPTCLLPLLPGGPGRGCMPASSAGLRPARLHMHARPCAHPSLATALGPLPRSLLRCRLSDERAQGIVREAVDIECRFVCDQLPLGAIGLGAAAMEQARGLVGCGGVEDGGARGALEWQLVWGCAGANWQACEILWPGQGGHGACSGQRAEATRVGSHCCRAPLPRQLLLLRGRRSRGSSRSAALSGKPSSASIPWARPRTPHHSQLPARPPPSAWLPAVPAVRG